MNRHTQRPNQVFSRNLLWMSPTLDSAVRLRPLVVVGCGGLGMSFIIAAAHIGFDKFTICDPDCLELSNLNRTIVGTRRDVGKSKVSIIKAYLQSHPLNTQVSTIEKPFPNNQVIEAIRESGRVISCFDHARPRIELDIICRKLGIPVFDLGTGFPTAVDPSLTTSRKGGGGQVLVSRPGHACLMCLGFGLANPKNDYYSLDGTPEPSSILINNIVATLAVERLIADLQGNRIDVNHVAYDRDNLAIVSRRIRSRSSCPVCGPAARQNVLNVGEYDTFFKT
jgi:molybdopterin/thiamine biosynthesis adenylyltransferase